MQNLLYRMNIGKVRTIDGAARAIRDGRPEVAMSLLGGIELKVNIRFRYLYYLVLGAAHLQLRQLPAAQNCFEEVIALEKLNGAGYFQLAVALARSGDVAAAIQTLDNALSLALDPELPEQARDFLGELRNFSSDLGPHLCAASIDSLFEELRAKPPRQPLTSYLGELDVLHTAPRADASKDRLTFFLGECVRENYGGEWRWVVPLQESFIVCAGPGEATVIPLQFLDDDSLTLTECYHDMTRRLG